MMNDLSLNLKTIELDGNILYYNIGYYANDIGDMEWTDFWVSKPKTKMIKRWWIFGELEEVINQEPDFRVSFDITSNEHTKDEVRKQIKRKLELFYRQNEIDNGDII